MTAPRARRSLIGVALAGVLAFLAARGRSRRSAQVLAIAREHVLTAAALAAVDFGAFHWGGGIGWIVTGVSLLALDFAVTG